MCNLSAVSSLRPLRSKRRSVGCGRLASIGIPGSHSDGVLDALERANIAPHKELTSAAISTDGREWLRAG